MLSNLFLKTLRDSRRSMLWWSIGLAGVALWVILLYPSIGASEGYQELLEELPPSMKAFIGDVTNLGSPEGYLHSELFFFLAPVVFLVLTVGFGGGTIAKEEERGTLDLLLSTPLPRWLVVTHKFAAMTVIIVVAALALWVGLAVGAAIVGVDVSLWRMLQASISGVLLGLAFGALALTVACLTGKRGLSLGVTGAVAVVTFLLNGFGATVEGLEAYRKVSPFYYYSAAEPLANGLSLAHAAVLLGLTALLFSAALIAFQKRDLAV